MRPGLNPKNVNIKNDAGTTMDMAFLAHFRVAASDAVALSADGVLGATNLGAAAQEITSGLSDPAVPRGLSVVGNVAGIAGGVVIEGTDFAGEEISETLALNGATPRLGVKAFGAVTTVALPAQTHTPVCQTETKTVTHAVDNGGHVTLDLTAVALGGASPKAVVVALTTAEDDVTKTAHAIAEALNADQDVGAAFVATHLLGAITLTAKAPAANDAGLSLAFTDTDTTGVTTGASTNGATGVPYDIVTIGWSDVLGLPFRLAHNTVLTAYLDDTIEATPATVTVSPTALESNTIKLASALDGHVVDAYLIA